MSDTSPSAHSSADCPTPPPQWEREVIEKLAFAALVEQRRARRWSIFFKLSLLAYLLVLLWLIAQPRLSSDLGDANKPHTAIIHIDGMIAQDHEASAEMIIESLRDALKDKKTQGVILHLNTPGGSPVQADEIYQEIRRLKTKHPAIPLYAVIADICASGGYYIAAAADKIYANPASIVGSIGVLMNGFGFVESLQKLGIERRLLTAGEHKAMLDPFLPQNETELVHMRRMLQQVHQQFIDAVRQGRGERLVESSDVFSGLVWTGKEALQLGLIDGLGSADYVAREIIGAEKLVDFTQQERLLDRIAGRLGATLQQAMTNLVGAWEWR